MNLSRNKVDVCYKDICVKAKGKNADAISVAIIFALTCIGLGILAKTIK